MRDSFEEQWLSGLPTEWVEKRADFLCDPYRITVDPGDYEDDLVAHYSIPQVQDTGGPVIERASDISSTKLLVNDPMLLVSKLNPRKQTICTAEPHDEYVTLASSEFVAISSSVIDQRYAFFLWSSQKVTDRLSAIVQSATRSHQRVSPSDITKLPWKWPPLDVQRRIAGFLDEKTARIDALIAKKWALLERLAEKRQALITRAVTQGLAPDAPRKWSGIDWLGGIPAHWEILPLRRVAIDVATGRTPPSSDGDYFSEGELNWFTPGDFTGEIELQDSARKITVQALGDGVATLFPPGTIMLVGIGATLGKVAVSVEAGSANQQITAIVPEVNSDPHYLAYFPHGFRQEVRVMSNGNTLGILNQDGTKALTVLRPPLEEQQRIAAVLKNQDASDADIHIRVQQSLMLLAECRAALVTAAVTGQIEGLR